MKSLILALALLIMVPAIRADEDKVTVPRSMLTQEQIKKLDDSSPSKWVGLGKEVGDAVNSSLQAITTQTSNFSQTKVGKLTMFLVVWKILGDMIVHLVTGFFLLIIFLTVWIWSYRKTCITRSIKTGKDTYEKVEYRKSGQYDDVSPRMGHAIALIIFGIVFLFTVFTY